jgi:uncharacterized membrane protein YdbT with pleckstrin-like domain
MRRPARYLASEERIVIDVRRHWTVLLDPFLQLIGVILAAALLGTIGSPSSGTDVLDTFLSVVTIYFVFRFLFKGVEWYANRVVVTNQRFIEVRGILTREVASMPLTKVTDLKYVRSLAGRIFNYGELVLESAGQQQAISSIDHLAHPDEFYRDVTTLLAQTHGRPSAATPPVPAPYEQTDEEETEDDGDTGPIPRVIV